MNSVYRLRSDELTSDFITLLKKAYPNKEIEITVNVVMDETDYLMSSFENRLHLENAIKNVEAHTNLVNRTLEEIVP